MASGRQVIQEWLDTASSDMYAGLDYFADDFQWVQTDGTVMDRTAYAGMANMLLSALPDLKHVVGEVREEGGLILLTSHFEGTHENDLDLSALGMGVFPASGRKIVFPEGSTKLSVRGDKIIRMEQIPGTSGMEDFFAALSA